MKILLGFASIAAVLALPRASWAFRVSPMIVSFSPSGRQSTQNFILDNSANEQIAVQVQAFHRNVDLDGKETRTPSDEFSIYPEQLVLQPNQKRNVRVTWTGSRILDHELSYRVVVTQLPVHLQQQQKQLSKAAASLTFLMQYVASVYITPGGVTPHIVVDSIQVKPHGKAELVLKNVGTAHRIVKSAQIFLSSGSVHEEVSPEQLVPLQGENFLSGLSRRIAVRIPAGLMEAAKARPGSIHAEIKVQ